MLILLVMLSLTFAELTHHQAARLTIRKKGTGWWGLRAHLLSESFRLKNDHKPAGAADLGLDSVLAKA